MAAVGKVAIIAPSDGVTQVKTLDALRVSRELQEVTPQGISKVRLNLRLNLLAVDTSSVEATAKLLALKTLCGVPVQVREPHGSYGAVGVVYNIPPGVTESQLEAAIRCRSPIVAVRAPRSPGGPAVVTFASARLPAHVLVGLVEHRVHPHVERPPRCRRCGRIGHVQVVCCSPATCRRCGGAHGRALCPAARPACVNCGQQHEPCSNACPKWREALRIARYRSRHKVDYATAKAVVTQRTPLVARPTDVKPKVAHTIDKLVQALLWLCQKFL
ncbi:hypothetical protein MTO96_011283 [Rhipicephalus appendiculatus]